MSQSRLLILTVWLALCLPTLSACQQPPLPAIIPQPVKVTTASGFFNLTRATVIQYPNTPEWLLVADAFTAAFQPATGIEFKQLPYEQNKAKIAANQVVFQADADIAHPEGYRLDINSQNIIIRSATAQGAFYAIQTLRQLFPAVVFAADLQQNIQWQAPACTIEDYPRFAYRGLHLDVGRHFMPTDFIKRYIDLLALHKMNRFHWHLTDDQGWRIEIKRYPKLQSVAACRKETLIGHFGDKPEQYDGVQYCHFYTQEEVKEVVKYAESRFVTIVPEIEMPGHARAALAAYPELGCTGGPYTVATTWGVHNEVFCAGNDSLYTFLDHVLAEVCALFPGQYVHVGGDECPKDRWKTCPKCQAKIKTLGLKDEHELQSHVISRAAVMLAKYDKKLIGWDEILEGGLEPSATVMSWRGEEGGIAAAKAGHDAVMTPGSYCYLDYYQSNPENEPLAIGGLLPLGKVYEYDPIPAVLSAEEGKHILGVQGNLWTEYIATPEKVEYMVYPRACALAEVAWTPTKQKNWNDFTGRLKQHFDRLSALKVNYALSYFDVEFSFDAGSVRLNTLDKDATIRYTLDGTAPGAESPQYTKPILLRQTATINAAAFLGNVKKGKVSSASFLVHKASGKPYKLSKKPEKYTGGNTMALTDGVTGGLKTWNGWVGLVNHDIDPVIDMGKPTDFNKVTTHFIHATGSWIHGARQVELLVSRDGKNFRSLGVKTFNVSEIADGAIHTVAFDVPRNRARYIKVAVKSTGVIPAGYPGAGEGAWLFVDEVVVE